MKPASVDRVLFVGTGGGNDVFSTLLAAASLWEEGWRWRSCDIGGVISPFHKHNLVSTNVSGVFFTTQNSTRRLLSKDGSGKAIRFVDAKVAEMLVRTQYSQPYDVGRMVLALSLEGGTVGLEKAFTQLANEYDLIVLVDVGGDCFYSGAEDKHILSPMFDAMVIRAFVDSGVNGFLFEAGPGTDGELEPESLTQALVASGGMENAKPLLPSVMDWWGEQYSTWIENYRPGRTVPMTLKAFRSTESFLQEQYRVRGHLGDVRRYKYFTQTISAELCQKFYLVDPSRIQNPFAVRCINSMDWFWKTQVCGRHTNNEANLEYFKASADGGLWQFLTPSPLLDPKDRGELINLGLQNLSQGVIDGALMMSGDWSVHFSRYWNSQLVVDEQREGAMMVSRRF